MDDIKAKQQVVEKIKSAGNILVTVSNDPSLDALSAALGLALIIDKLDKHATTIFSGQAPQAMQFLEPEKTFENTTDSLRDFIIALDKEKADHLRLKVEGDVAKIYITPYRTTIKPEDLQFSQGDNYNIELVVALGVDNQDHLDSALDAHGQILHDAPVVTITAGDQVSQLGGIDWHDSKASSLSEMIATLGEALKDQDMLIDKQSATALLTGIVAATDRFSNPKTTSASMTVAAQLMGYGADQQLIANELQKSHEIGAGVDMSSHGSETLADLDARVRNDDDETSSNEVEADIMSSNNSSNAYGLPESESSNAYGVPDESTAVVEATPESAPQEVSAESIPESTPPPVEEPSQPAPVEESTIPTVEPSANSAYALPDEPATSGQEIAPVSSVESQLVVNAALTPPPATPAELGLPMPPPVPTFTPPAPSSAYALDPASPDANAPQPPERLGDILNPDPDETAGAPANAIPILSHGAVVPPPEATPAPPAEPVPASVNDPTQFKIPGQP